MRVALHYSLSVIVDAISSMIVRIDAKSSARSEGNGPPRSEANSYIAPSISRHGLIDRSSGAKNGS